MTSDLDIVARFVVWGLRHRDLPVDVQAAALRLAETGEYPRPDRLPSEYVEGSWRVTAFPADEDQPLEERRCHQWQLGPTVEELAPGARYLLVDDPTQLADAD